MKQYLYWIGLCLLLLDVVACKPEMDDDLPPTDAVDTTAADTLLPYDCLHQDTTILDTTTYEDAPIWLPGAQQYGFAKGKKNGKDFEAGAGAYRFNAPYDTLLVVSFATFGTPTGYVREVVSFGGIRLYRTGYYQMVSVDNSSYLSNDNICDGYYGHFDDDVIGDIYKLDTLSRGNCLNITEIDTLNKVVKGVFSATFLYADPYVRKEDPRNPNRCVFRNVYFECKIIR